MTCRHQFYPAIIPYVLGERYDWRDPIHWLDDEGPEDLFFPAALISYAHWRREGWPWKDDDRYTAFGDSGGYTVVTKGESFDPVSVLRWQIRNCTKGAMLDIPPYRPGSTIQFSGTAAQYWDESMKRSIRNVERALPIYQQAREEGSGFRWWGAVQGESLAQMVEWHGRIAEVYPFDEEGEGWCLAPKPSTDILSATRYLKFAREAGLRGIHLLQVSSAQVLGVIFSLMHLDGEPEFDIVTYDSASATRCAINRTVIHRDGLALKFLKQRGNGDGIAHDHLMGTDHPAARFYQESYPLTNPEWPHYVLLYNHVQMVEAFEHLWTEAASHPEEVLRAVLGKKWGKVMREWEGAVEHAKPQGKKVSLFDRL